MKDIILREVRGYGWLPIVEVDGKEIYRGEYHPCEYAALLAVGDWEEEQCLIKLNS